MFEMPSHYRAPWTDAHGSWVESTFVPIRDLSTNAFKSPVMLLKQERLSSWSRA